MAEQVARHLGTAKHAGLTKRMGYAGRGFDMDSPENVARREDEHERAAKDAARMVREGMLPRWHSYGGTAPSRDAWIRKASGASPSKGGFYAEAEDRAEAAIAAGEGFDDLDVLEYAYCAYRDQHDPYLTNDAEPFAERPNVVPIRPLELLGVAEVCSLLRLKRMQLKRLRDAGKFPEPVAELAAGPIWNVNDLPERGER